MLSPPHRANLLNAAYDVIGVAVVRSGDQLYVVQDFGHALPTYTAPQAKEQIAAAVAQIRHRANQSNLALVKLSTADEAACSMANDDKLGTLPVHQLAQRYTVLSYAGLQPTPLPLVAEKALSNGNLQNFSIGTCYARTPTYPTGAYWIVLSLE
jgi:uncharacterized protein YkwD